MGKETIIAWSTKASSGLNQAITSGVEFAMVSADNHQCSPWMYCKDYVQDAIHGRLNNKRNRIYGFCYNPKAVHQPCLTSLKLLVANSSDGTLRKKIPNCMDFLNQIEEHLGISKTVISECAKPPIKYSSGGVWLIEANRRWLVSPVMLSLFTLLIRIGFGHEIGIPAMETMEKIVNGKQKTYCNVDHGRLQTAIDGIKKIWTAGDTKIFGRLMKKNYPSKLSVHTMHNEMGICAFAKQITKQHMPQWHK